MDQRLREIERRIQAGDESAYVDLERILRRLYHDEKKFEEKMNEYGWKETQPLLLPDLRKYGFDEGDKPEGYSNEEWWDRIYSDRWIEVIGRTGGDFRDQEEKTLFARIYPLDRQIEVREVERNEVDEDDMPETPYTVTTYLYNINDLKWGGSNQENILYYFNNITSEISRHPEGWRKNWINRDVTHRAVFLAEETGDSVNVEFLWGEDALPDDPERIFWNRWWGGQAPTNIYAVYDSIFRDVAANRLSFRDE